MGTSTKGMRPAPMGAGYPAPGDPTGYSDRMSHAAADHPGMSARRLPAVEERSAGGVVVDVHEGEARIAVIARRNRAGRIEWCLPKGHIEGDETLPQTAAREVAEETGIEGKVLIELGTIDYWFAAGERRIHKYVHHYLLEATGGHLTIENDPDHDPDKPDARLELQKQRNGDTQHYTQHLWFCKAAQQFATTPRRLPVSYVPFSGDAVYAQQ